MDREVDVDADPAVDVQGGVRDSIPAVGGPELRGGDLEGVVAPFVEVRRRLEHRELDRLVVDVAIGHALPDCLEGSDLAVELLALRRVVRSQAKRLVGDTGDDGTRRDHCAAEREREDLAALLRCSEPRVVTDAHAVEPELEQRLVVHDLLAFQRHACRVRGDEEHTDAVVDARRDHDELGRGGARDTSLQPVEPPAVSIARRGRRRPLRLAAVFDERGREQ